MLKDRVADMFEAQAAKRRDADNSRSRRSVATLTAWAEEARGLDSKHPLLRRLQVLWETDAEGHGMPDTDTDLALALEAIGLDSAGRRRRPNLEDALTELTFVVAKFARDIWGDEEYAGSLWDLVNHEDPVVALAASGALSEWALLCEDQAVDQARQHLGLSWARIADLLDSSTSRVYKRYRLLNGDNE